MTGATAVNINISQKLNDALPTFSLLIVGFAFILLVLVFRSLLIPLGFALTFGVLFNAFVVRMTIVPAIMSLMGKSAWYLPAWLDRILPDLDIEGESIMKERENKRNGPHFVKQ